MSSVHYKFKSCLNYDTVTFDGLHISLADLKKAIIQQKKLGKSVEFDLQITNAQSNQRYVCDDDLIPKNASVIVTRVPVNEPQRSQMRTWLPRSDDYRKSPNNQDFMHDRLSQTPDLANADASENDKIEAMLAQSKFFDPLSYSKGKALSGTPPLGYVCFKCGKPGHYIYSCSLKGEPNMGDMKIKRSTGIPLSFLTVVDSPDHPGALLTHSGHFAVPTIDAMAYKMGKRERPPFLPDPTPVTTAAVVSAPSELLCPLCNELLTDAVVIPCCGNSFCDECVRNALLDSEDHECPSCHEIDVSPDKLISNILLRQAVINYHNQTGYTKVKRDQIAAPQQQQQQQQQPPQPAPSQQQEQPQQQQQTQLKMNQLQQTAQFCRMPQQMQKLAAEALPPTAATSAPLAAAAAAETAVVTSPPVAAAAEGVPIAATPAGAHPQHPVHTPLVAPADSRLPSSEQGPNSLHDDKPISHRPGEPHKGMAVPVLGARLRNIRPLQLVRDMNRIPGPMRSRLADRAAVVRNPGHPHQAAPVMQHMPQVLTSAQQQTPASYIPSRASLPAATMPGPTYRMPHPPPPGVSSGPVMPPPSGFIAPPIAPYSAGPRLYQIRSVPTGPRPLTPEEFYREKRRLIEEDKKKSDPFDDFARELMEFRQEQKRRQVDLNYTLSSSRSRSRSNSRSYSRSPRSSSRSYRSRSSSRSRSRSRYRSSSPSRGGSSSSRSRSSSRGPPPASSRGRRYRSRTRSRSRSRSYTPARKYSRSRSRSRSMTRSRSRSRSPLSTFYHHHHHHRHSRSPGRSRRSRTPPYRSRGRTRSPLAPISTRDPFYRKDWSPSYSRNLRSTAAPAGASVANSSSHGPGKRFSPPERPFPPRFPHYTPPQRPEDYYRYDSHAYEDYYSDYFSRYAPHTPYPAPATLTTSAASSVATGYDRPYYDMRGRPVTQSIAPSAVNVVVGSNSPPNRPRKRPVSQSPLRRERTRDKSDSKTGKSTAGGEPAAAAKPAKEKTKKTSKVVDEDGHHKRLERKREEKAERLAREKSNAAAGLVSTKKSTSRSGEKALSKEKKKVESKRVKLEKGSASKTPSVPLDTYGKQGSENLKDSGCSVNTNNPGSTAATAASATNTAAVSSVAAAKRREATEKTVSGVVSKRIQETHIDPQAATSNPKMVHLTTLADAKESANVSDTRAVSVASSSSRAGVTVASAAASSAAKLKRKARLQQQPIELAQKGSSGPPTDDVEKTLTSKKSRREVSTAEKGLQESEYGSKALDWSGRHESDMMLPAPELSKWERDDYEVHMEPMKPKKKPLERKPLPKSVIESAEKAITEKRLKPSVLPPRKVYVDDKDTRKPGSVQITIVGGEKSRAEPVDRRSQQLGGELVFAMGRSHRPTSREAALVSPSFSSSAAGPSSNVASAAIAAAGTASLSSVSSQAKGHHHHHHHHQPQRQRHHHHHHQDVRIARSSDSKDGGSGGGSGSGGVAARVGERFERKESMVDEAKFVPDYSESGSESDDVAASGNTDVAADPSQMTSSRRVTSVSGTRRSSSSRTASAAGGSSSRVGGSSGGGGDAGVTTSVEEQEEPCGKRRSGKRSKESGMSSSGGGKKNKKHKKHKKHKSKKSKHKSKKSHKQRHRSGSREKSAARLLHQSSAAAMPSSSPGVTVAAISAGVSSASLSTAATTATTKGHSTYHHDSTHQPVDGGKVRSSIATKY